MSVRFSRVSQADELPPLTSADSGSLPDLRSRIDVTLESDNTKTHKIPLNVRVEIPQAHFGILFLRSSLALKGLSLTAGLIDNSFRFFSVLVFFVFFALILPNFSQGGTLRSDPQHVEGRRPNRKGREDCPAARRAQPPKPRVEGSGGAVGDEQRPPWLRKLRSFLTI